MSGLFYFRSLLPDVVKRNFIKYIEHPIATIYKREILDNNGFYLLHRNNSMNLDWNTYSQGKTFMWWAYSLVRDVSDSLEVSDIIHISPLHFDMKNDIKQGDVLVRPDEYDIDNNENTGGNIYEAEKRDIRRESCINSLWDCYCNGDEQLHNYLSISIEKYKLEKL